MNTRRPLPPAPALRQRPARGFTLIEVLVAVAIVATTLAAGLRAAGTLTDNAKRLNDVTLAQWCADNQLTELKLQHQFPNEGRSPFSCRQLGTDFKGSLVVQSTPNPSFRRVDAVVADDAGQPLLTVSTVLSRY